jgi:hypothetical protein
MKLVTLAEIEVGKTYTLTYESGASISCHVLEIIRSKSGRYKYTSTTVEKNAQGEIIYERGAHTKRAFKSGNSHIWYI